MSRRRLLTATTGGVAGLALGGCLDSAESVVGADTDDDESITIGLLAPKPDSNYVGRSMQRSAALAVDELNDGGGINGRHVELAVGNTNGNPLETRRQYQRLVLEEAADVTVGVFDSPSLVNILDDIAEQETIHLTSGAATTTPSERIAADYDRYKYHFRVGPPNDHHLGQGQVDFLDDMAAEVGWESVALLAEDYEWTKEPWDVYQTRLPELGLDVVMEQRYPPAMDDFSGVYDEVQDHGADAAIMTTAHTGNETVRDWALNQRPFAFGGIHVPMQLPVYYEQTNGACAYGFGLTTATAQSSFGGSTEAFITAYQDTYEGPNPVYTGYHTYDAITLFAHVVEQTGTLDADELVAALEDVSFSGTVGTVEFEGLEESYPHDFRYYKDQMHCFQWQPTDDGDGVQEIIWPDEHATSEYIAPN
ncbi:branched-chain amino acid ABC transporter substrate-binding protein [Natronorubrum sulfidifaciens JCM 14089]|uniref:Branched-chain amino acid ABC transporter substrate-binding protein n=2 Tax=Natronorubrum sulfidifaciens TaxID=388259 RepID=L9WA30_9EURY|nr:branched-chain amino acid ABC transporter substrate-binding protein [Natronorubrum sulfidifaciens JCM 14089]